MKPHEIFRVLSSSELDALVYQACQDDEIPDKLAGGVITYQQIPLRRFMKLGEEMRRAYVRRTLRDKRASDLALFVLSAALTRTQAGLISSFLDGVGLPHKGPALDVEGAIPEPPDERLGTAIDAALAAHDTRSVALYLHAFAAQPDVTWPALDARLAADARLALADLSAT